MPVKELWTDDELRAALEAYLFVHRLEQAGLVIAEERLFALLQDGPLLARNETSLRYRMRNISAVFRDLGRPTIVTYPPADKVGTGVQARIEAMLGESPQSESLVSSRAHSREREILSPLAARAKAKRALDELATALDALDPDKPGIGHNQPPEAIDAITGEDLRRTIAAVEDLRDEISSTQPSAEIVGRKTEEIATVGIQWAAWFGKRGTKVVDATINTVVPTALLALMGVLPALINAVEALINLLLHLP